MAMKQAAIKPAPRFQTSVVKRYVAIAVSPLHVTKEYGKKNQSSTCKQQLMREREKERATKRNLATGIMENSYKRTREIYLKIGARKTQTSRIWTVMLRVLRTWWIRPDVTIKPGYTCYTRSWQRGKEKINDSDGDDNNDKNNNLIKLIQRATLVNMNPHNERKDCIIKKYLKGNSHQILPSEMSLPGVEVPIEKLLPKILGRLEKDNPSKRRCKVAFVQRKCAMTSSVSVRFLYATYN